MTGRPPEPASGERALAGAERQARARSGLSTGLSVLEMIASAPRPPNLTQIADQLGMSKPGIHATIATLLQRGYVSRDAAGRYVMGLRAWELGARMPGAAIGLAATASMARLSDEVAEGVILGMLDGWDVVYLQVVESPQAVRVNADLGARIPAHCTSTGLALLAALDPAEVAARMPARLEAVTPMTITAPAALEAELDLVRREGFAINRGGWRADVGGVAAGIRTAPGGPAVAGLCVAAPLYRITPDWLARVCAALGRAAAAIGANIGAASGPDAGGARAVASSSRSASH